MSEEEVAKRRFWLMQMCRLGALVCVIVGVAAIAPRGFDRPELGYPLVLIGAFGFFALPVYLSRRWKSR